MNIIERNLSNQYRGGLPEEAEKVRNMTVTRLGYRLRSGNINQDECNNRLIMLDKMLGAGFGPDRPCVNNHSSKIHGR